MRYGVMNSPMRPLLQEVEELGRYGFDYLEITMDAPFAHHSVIGEQKQALSKEARRAGMALAFHLPTFVSTADLTESLREASIQETLKSMQVAAEFDPIKVVLHPSFIHGLGAMMRDEAQRHADAATERLVRRAQDLNLPLCIENMFPNALSLALPEDFDAVFAAFPELKLTLDTGHAHIGGGTRRILAFIDRFGDRIGHVHASDNFGRNDDHLPIGAGTIDFAAVAAKLKSTGYDDTITLEVFSRDRDYLRISREKLDRLFVRK
jgi:sugar phosphate isomerase/epimerase